MPMRSSDQSVCAATLRQGSRSFAAASLLLPRGYRRQARALYGFCRVADDLIDESPEPARTATVAALRARLQRACDGAPDATPIDRAFAAALQDCGIPRALPEALLEGFAWDAEARQYPDIAALRAYAARVAGTVGAMMTLVLGARDAPALARACELGVAMQLTNIARDVGADARAGRLYLPLNWLTEAGIDPVSFLAAPAHSAALGTVVARLLQEAETLYARAESGIALLPISSRPAIRAALRLYREIGRAVLHRGADGVTTRAVVAPSRKLRLIACCLLPSIAPGRRASLSAPALSETQFLLNAVPRRTAIAQENKLIWVLELFARLEQRDQLRSPG
jgi:phytoene synthase